jgi:hypothetical protein
MPWNRSGLRRSECRKSCERDMVRDPSRYQDAPSQADEADTQSLILTKGMRHGYHIVVSKKSDFARLDKSRKFQNVSEAKSVKVYVYHVS